VLYILALRHTDMAFLNKEVAVQGGADMAYRDTSSTEIDDDV